MFAYDYPLLGLFWTMFILFVWVAWIVLLFRVFADLFRNKELGGLGKAVWAIFVILVPFLGVFVYLIAHGRGMGQRDLAEAEAEDAAFRAYVQDAAAPASAADELTKLTELTRTGALSEAEFEQQKAKLLA